MRHIAQRSFSLYFTDLIKRIKMRTGVVDNVMSYFFVRSMSKIAKKRTHTSRVSRDNFVTKWTDDNFVVDKSIIRNQYYIYVCMYVCMLYYFLSCQYFYGIDVNKSTVQKYIQNYMYNTVQI